MNEGRRGGNPTIYDIAAHVGVAASTVSRALRAPGRLNAETEARIRAAAEELGYRPNPSARALPIGRAGSIGLALPDLGDPLWAALVVAAETAAAASGRTLVVGDAERSPGPELTRRLADGTDGLVLVDSTLSDAEIQDLAARHPTVSVCRDVPGVRSVLPDLSVGFDDALGHLLALGHRQIAYLSIATASRMRAENARALAQRAATLGIRLERVPIDVGNLDGAAARMRAIGATAAITQNDLVAVAMLQALRSPSVGVAPSIIGIDDLYVAALVSPALSTIRVPLPELVARAVAFVLAPPQEPLPGDPLTAQYIRRGTVAAPGSTERPVIHAAEH